MLISVLQTVKRVRSREERGKLQGHLPKFVSEAAHCHSVVRIAPAANKECVCVGRGTITIVHARLQPQDGHCWLHVCGERRRHSYYAESSTSKSSPLAVEIKLPVKTNTKGPISIEPQVGRTDVAPCVHLPCTDLHNLYKPMAWLKLDCCKQTAYACLEHPCELVIPNLQVAIQ